MLKAAQLYEDMLKMEMVKTWYKPENIYYHGSTGEYIVELPDNNEKSHCFASIDKNGNLIGYICYDIDWQAKVAYQWGIISFRKGKIEFAKDVYQAICDCFNVYHLNKIEWYCYADNPAIRGYRNFVKKHGGRECGYTRQTSMLRDGKLHDSVCFEILACEFRP